MTRLVRPKEAAKMLGVCRQTLESYERRGILPKRRAIGPRHVGWLKEELQALLDNAGRGIGATSALKRAR